jgi:hypothetical protein
VNSKVIHKKETGWGLVEIKEEFTLVSPQGKEFFPLRLHTEYKIDDTEIVKIWFFDAENKPCGQYTVPYCEDFSTLHVEFKAKREVYRIVVKYYYDGKVSSKSKEDDRNIIFGYNTEPLPSGMIWQVSEFFAINPMDAGDLRLSHSNLYSGSLILKYMNAMDYVLKVTNVLIDHTSQGMNPFVPQGSVDFSVPSCSHVQVVYFVNSLSNTRSSLVFDDDIPVLSGYVPKDLTADICFQYENFEIPPGSKHFSSVFCKTQYKPCPSEHNYIKLVYADDVEVSSKFSIRDIDDQSEVFFVDDIASPYALKYIRIHYKKFNIPSLSSFNATEHHILDDEDAVITENFCFEKGVELPDFFILKTRYPVGEHSKQDINIYGDDYNGKNITFEHEVLEEGIVVHSGEKDIKIISLQYETSEVIMDGDVPTKRVKIATILHSVEQQEDLDYKVQERIPYCNKKFLDCPTFFDIDDDIDIQAYNKNGDPLKTKIDFDIYFEANSGSSRCVLIDTEINDKICYFIVTYVTHVLELVPEKTTLSDDYSTIDTFRCSEVLKDESFILNLSGKIVRGGITSVALGYGIYLDSADYMAHNASRVRVESKTLDSNQLVCEYQTCDDPKALFPLVSVDRFEDETTLYRSLTYKIEDPKEPVCLEFVENIDAKQFCIKYLDSEGYEKHFTCFKTDEVFGDRRVFSRLLAPYPYISQAVIEYRKKITVLEGALWENNGSKFVEYRLPDRFGKYDFPVMCRVTDGYKKDVSFCKVQYVFSDDTVKDIMLDTDSNEYIPISLMGSGLDDERISQIVSFRVFESFKKVADDTQETLCYVLDGGEYNGKHFELKHKPCTVVDKNRILSNYSESDHLVVYVNGLLWKNPIEYQSNNIVRIRDAESGDEIQINYFSDRKPFMVTNYDFDCLKDIDRSSVVAKYEVDNKNDWHIILPEDIVVDRNIILLPTLKNKMVSKISLSYKFIGEEEVDLQEKNIDDPGANNTVVFPRKFAVGDGSLASLKNLIKSMTDYHSWTKSEVEDVVENYLSTNKDESMLQSISKNTASKICSEYEVLSKETVLQSIQECSELRELICDDILPDIKIEIERFLNKRIKLYPSHVVSKEVVDLLKAISDGRIYYFSGTVDDKYFDSLTSKLNIDLKHKIHSICTEKVLTDKKELLDIFTKVRNLLKDTGLVQVFYDRTFPETERDEIDYEEVDVPIF